MTRQAPSSNVQDGRNIVCDTVGYWYVVNTNPNKEQVAVKNLRNQDFTVFLPQLKKTIRHAGQFRAVTRPLFPQYLFVQMDIEEARWRSVNGTFGVRRLLTAGDDPCPLPEGFVETLINMTGEDSNFSFERQLKPGDQVEVLAGPFTNFIGQLETLEPSGRALLLLDLMGREVRVWSDAKSISIAD